MNSRNHDAPLEDTSPEALRVQYAALRRLTARQRLALMDDLSVLARTLAREGIRRRNPEANEGEIDRLFAELVLGPELAAKVRAHRTSRRGHETP